MRLLKLAIRFLGPDIDGLALGVISFVKDVKDIVAEAKASHGSGDLVEDIVPMVEDALLGLVTALPEGVRLDKERAEVIASGLAELAIWIDELYEQGQSKRG